MLCVLPSCAAAAIGVIAHLSMLYVSLQVCGEAVLVVEATSQADLCRQLERLASKHLRGRRWRLAGSWETASAAGSISGAGQSPQEQRQRQLQLQQRLLRRSMGAATEGAAAAMTGEQAPAPRTPQHPPKAYELSALAEQRTQQEGLIQAGGAVLSPQRELAPPSTQTAVSDPRQQLLWSMAGRATSLSWQDELAAAAAAGAAVAAAAAAAPAGAQPEAAAGPAAPAVPVGQAGGGSGGHEDELEQAGSPSSQPPSARQRSSLDRSPWADLQPEMLAVVLAQAGEHLLLHAAGQCVCACLLRCWWLPSRSHLLGCFDGCHNMCAGHLFMGPHQHY